jgi:rhamnose transport system substrate-binding protein
MLRCALALALAAVIAAGCNSSNSSNAAAGGSGSTAKIKLVYIPKNTGNPYFQPVIDGFKSVARGENIDFDTQAPATADATSQLSIIKDQIQRGVDVIALSPNSPDALNETLDQAKAKGIIVITIDSDLTGNEDHRDAGVMSTDFTKVGPSQLELLAKSMNYEGEFAILSATVDAPNQNAWIAGMKEALKDPKYSKMKLVDTVYGDDEPQKSSTETESLLSKHPNLKGIVAPTSVGLSAAAQVLENQGVYPGGPNAKNGGVILTGLSTPNQMKKAVEKGVVASFQLWDPADMGIIAGCLAAEVRAKKLEVVKGATFDVPGKGTFTIGDKNVISAGPLLTFDKTNIAKYNF